MTVTRVALFIGAIVVSILVASAGSWFEPLIARAGGVAPSASASSASAVPLTPVAAPRASPLARLVPVADVTPSSAWVTVADTDVALAADRIAYRGSRWAHVSGFRDGRHNGTSSRSDRSGDVATFHFTGQRIAVYGVDGHAGGFAKLSLDGMPIGQADFFSPSVEPKIVYMSPRLIPGKHTLAIEVTGDRPERSDGDFVNINYAKIQP